MRNLFGLFLLIALCATVSVAQVRLAKTEVDKLIIESSKPVYAESNKLMRMQGEIKVDVTVSEKGLVEKVKFVSGNSLLVPSATKTANLYKFKPYQVNGNATRFITSLEFFFSLGSTKEEVADEMKLARDYFAEDNNCRKLLRENKWTKAETSCRLSVSIAEKLPSHRYVEKYSAYRALGVALLRQRKIEEAISYFEKSLEIAKPHIDDTDSETGDIYYLLGQANHLLGKLDKAREFYTKAENTYRAAFKEIDDDVIRQPYPRAIKYILEAHLIAVEDLGLKDESEKIKERLNKLKIEFSKFLEN